MARANRLQFNLLTKRVDRMKEYVTGWFERRSPLHNLRIGLSVGTQEYLDARWPLLRDTPAARRHLSIQPMLEAIHLSDDATLENLDWVVVMREIGPGARTMKVEWVRDLREQCELRGIPFFWETTDFDDAKMVEERRRAEDEGRPYGVQEDLWARG